MKKDYRLRVFKDNKRLIKGRFIPFSKVNIELRKTYLLSYLYEINYKILGNDNHIISFKYKKK